MVTPEQIVTFWVDEVGPEGWYAADAARDDEIRKRFRTTWDEAREGACGLWLTNATGTLGYIILTDQFPRNMFRDDPRAFATDCSARAAAKVAIDRGWDRRVAEPARQFLYMPLVHSENLCDQDRAVRLMALRMPETGAENLRHAKAHREVIREFGRFPYRNDALGRETSAAETAWMAEGGYMTALATVDAAERTPA
ncbi:DUF924 family protein [Salibaculum halophilum]|uniref:DUF924 family protein n=1 Tax=Salibaculum halophilum TaxID=1914408 RepID=UPI000A1148C5|nr:DUF924 family protein [Salibaculum halophilum]